MAAAEATDEDLPTMADLDTLSRELDAVDATLVALDGRQQTPTADAEVGADSEVDADSEVEVGAIADSGADAEVGADPGPGAATDWQG